MFGLFKKDPIKQLESDYRAKMEEAQQAQRNGDIATFSKLSVVAEEIAKKIDELKAQDAG